MRKVHAYLISDFTGETVNALARAIFSQFATIKFIEHEWPLVRTNEQIDQILSELKITQGIVICTIYDTKLQASLTKGCKKLSIPCIQVIKPIIDKIADFLSVDPKKIIQTKISKEYYERLDAIKFSIDHDDGKGIQTLNKANIIIVGISRTSKSPLSLYLAYRGYRTANIPFIYNINLPKELSQLKHILIVALTMEQESMIKIRNNRELMNKNNAKYHNIINNTNTTNYAKPEAVISEIEQSLHFYYKQNWPVIDITNKSVEEVAALIIRYYHIKNSNSDN
jgi:regulator of PEP synthase PpsR (kinase-PPPase family)